MTPLWCWLVEEMSIAVKKTEFSNGAIKNKCANALTVVRGLEAQYVTEFLIGPA